MKNRHGFTLIEMVMVIMLVGILGIVAIPNFIDLRTDAKDAITKDRMQTLKRAIMGDGRLVAGGTYSSPGYYADMGRLPTALSELVTQGAQTSYDAITRVGWRGPYVDSSSISDYSKDAWGTTFVYSTASRHIRSWGPDRANDTGGDDDITLTF